MAGRKVFTSGEILTSADVNSFLMDQSVMVFADSTARSSAIPTPSEGMVTYLKDTNLVQAFTGSEFAAVGTILQVVQGTMGDAVSISAGSFQTITNLNASITPTSASSKILATVSFGAMDVTNADLVLLRLLRGATAIGLGNVSGSRTRVTSTQVLNQDRARMESFTFLDSPATTSATTYGIEAKILTASLLINRGNTDADNADRGRALSTMTLMEVAG